MKTSAVVTCNLTININVITSVDKIKVKDLSEESQLVIKYFKPKQLNLEKYM